ncbi:uncharacterized protein LOC126379575 [Pectinophora gossypiella]|uniref:uncharacterized protein LOC126379575 n=1 Tax=Pectinophora gossypiella TaxID=13191 RepID=UPI00214E630B|nr:uncharacterized protein LOC126379575 [Pectinophora gossypiella]XP_049884336.1 uncharacterized protein LOC126379575 [Pectinophora gossypiella]XP_049884337.1 uncharacterized protein LOC126379575 [Pectinophora gossypiella]XP_049884338.1 uncharacterized protein LOC126379575 [Pectinophora gossypiella]
MAGENATFEGVFCSLFLLKSDSRADKDKNDEGRWDGELRRELSDSAYFATKEKAESLDYKFNYSIMEEVYIRMERFDNTTSLRRNDYWPFNDWGRNVLRQCKSITTSFRTALTDFRRYFPLRVTYSETLEYEVGYLAYTIIIKYQNLLELFYIIHVRYALQNKTDKATTRFMFYMYRNMLHLGTSIVHLCNMMHEVERKYKGYVGLWSINVTWKMKKKKKKKKYNKNGLLTLQQKIRQIEKWKKAQAKKKRQQHQAGHIVIYVPTLEPARTNWPLIYGWSIEDFWMH